MARDDLEVHVAAEQLYLVAYRDHCDQAVGEPARRLSPSAAQAIQLGRGLVISRAIDAKEVLSVEQTPQPIAIRIVARPGQNLQGDHVGPRHLLAVLQGGVQ